MMRITVASGKGGTGKTLVSTSLASRLAEDDRWVLYADGDVGAPNGHIFLKPRIDARGDFQVKAPMWSRDLCRGCQACTEICAFNALLIAGGKGTVFKELCHSCGACVLACPTGALTEKERPLGVIQRGRSGRVGFLGGCLNVGEPRATPLIEEVVEESSDGPDDGWIILDSPPGTSCSAVAAARNADLFLLVTDPTPFGLHDLTLSVEMGKALNLSMASVINRCDLGDNRVECYLEKEAIPVLAKIPHLRSVATAYCRGDQPHRTCEEFKVAIDDLTTKLTEMLEGETT